MSGWEATLISLLYRIYRRNRHLRKNSQICQNHGAWFIHSYNCRVQVTCLPHRWVSLGNHACHEWITCVRLFFTQQLSHYANVVLWYSDNETEVVIVSVAKFQIEWWPGPRIPRRAFIGLSVIFSTLEPHIQRSVSSDVFLSKKERHNLVRTRSSGAMWCCDVAGDHYSVSNWESYLLQRESQWGCPFKSQTFGSHPVFSST